MSLLRSVMFMALFLSTLSLRRATWHLCFCIPCQCNFYPRSPCGERHQATCTQAHYIRYFYPRSPCGERPLAIPRHQQADAFLSTLSLRRATKICKYVARRNVISIHALLAESDIYCHLSGASYSISIHALLAESDGPWSTLPIGMANFYPRSPCGERLVVDGHRVHITRFLSTLSLRRATIILRYSVSLSVFSIHALLAESDQ